MKLRNLLYHAVLMLLCASSAAAQTEGDSLVRAFFHDTDSDLITPGDYAQSAENAFQLLNGAQAQSTLDWRVLDAKQRLAANRKIVRVLRKELMQHTNSGFRNLQLYGDLLEDIQAANIRLRDVLRQAADDLENSRAKIRTITSDSVIVQMVKADVSDTSRRGGRVKRLRDEYMHTSQLIKTSLDSINRWSAMASFQAITTAELIQKTDSIMQQSSIQALKGDCPYLWKASMNAGVADTTGSDLSGGTAGNHKIVNYYVQKNLTAILWIPVLVFILFFRWIWKNGKRVRTSAHSRLKDDGRLRFTRRSGALSALIVSLCLLPLLDVHAPWFYLLLAQCIGMGAAAYFFAEKPSRSLLPAWLALLALLVGVSVAGSFEPDLMQRCALILLNAGSVAASVFLLPRVRHLPQLPRTVRAVVFVHIALNVLAVLCNLFGRVIIAEALTNTAIVALTQIVMLSVFVEAIMEALYLQLLAGRIKRGIHPEFDPSPVLKAVHRPIYVFVLLVWSMMLMANLYMYEAVKDAVGAGLKAVISLGSLSFSVGNVLLFFVIIWIAHLLQLYIGSFFGDSETDEDVESKRQRSRMMVVKLVVICLGYLLAVAASGLPLDKITIILGALGVGVGMGLQSIVNNFVSGVVLIFDRPLQIGDSIEVGENSGKVKAIGIRASTLLTPEGAEVIIPNGDILSRPITNWTLSNNQRRVELEFTLQTSESRDAVISLIKNALDSYDDIVADREPTFSIEHIKENEIGLKVYFWCNNISKSEWIKSEVRYLLYGMFREKGIVVL